MTGRGYVMGGAVEYRRANPRTLKEAGLDHLSWESRAPALRPIWRDMATGIVAGLIILPPVILYVLPFVVAVVDAVAGK